MTAVDTCDRVADNQGAASVADHERRGKSMKRYQAPVVVASYSATELRAEATMVAVASIVTTTTLASG